jgi:serine kinase of HPr protein (carbohydrate metabolism regulator)
MNNILITGDRGIGKSSFANQLLYIAEGNNFLLNKMKIILPERKRLLSYATISIRTLPNMTLREIAGLIIRELIIKFDLISKKREIEHQIDLKVYKYKTKSLETKKDFEDIFDIFGYDLIKIHDALQLSPAP